MLILCRYTIVLKSCFIYNFRLKYIGKEFYELHDETIPFKVKTAQSKSSSLLQKDHCYESRIPCQNKKTKQLEAKSVCAQALLGTYVHFCAYFPFFSIGCIMYMDTILKFLILFFMGMNSPAKSI